VLLLFDERKAASLRRTLNVWEAAGPMRTRMALAADSKPWRRWQMSLLTVREHNAQKPEIAHFATSAHKRAMPL
jgi:hypothetical protein